MSGLIALVVIAIQQDWPWYGQLGICGAWLFDTMIWWKLGEAIDRPRQT